MNAIPSTEPRPLTSDDIFNIVLVNDAQISPDGSQVAYVQTRLDREANDYRSSIFLVAVDGGSRRQFTAANAQDRMPRWSPLGDRIVFLSDRSGSSQIWMIAKDGGEALQLTDLPHPVTFFTWSPDASAIAFVSKTDSADLNDRTGDADEESGKDDAKDKSDVVHITRTRFRKEGTPGFLDHKPTHIWVVPTSGGTPRQLTSGDYVDGQPAWAPSGHVIAFVSNRTEKREYNHASEIWTVSLDGGEPRPILSGENADFERPAWSPDGTQIAVMGHNDATSGGATNCSLWLVPTWGGQARNLTGHLDRWVGDAALSDTFAAAESELVWSPDGTSLLFQLSNEGNVELRRVHEDGRVEPVVHGPRRVLSFSQSADGSALAFTLATATEPCDIFVANADGSAERRLTTVNVEFFQSVHVSEPEEFRVPSQAADQREIHGWVIKPVGYQPGHRYPTVLEIHGGPHSMYGNAYFHEFQVLAAKGFAVVLSNPRGSQGYGQDFARGNRGRWGEADMPDVLAALDHAIEIGLADPARLGVTGGSYGGFMTNWIIGHSDRFKAAVTQRSVTNMLSMFGTSDIGSTFGVYEVGGAMPWDDPQAYLRMSPISYVHRMKTPLRIIHSEQDYRCPIEQAEQLYVALKMLDREVDFVRFPNENHNLSRSGKPKHRVERLNYIAGWFERHL